ncbi:MAG: enoyl-CoA hydratase [Candidatus Xenobia bacterium]
MAHLILVRLYERVAVVTLNRPEVRNALSALMRTQLRATVARLDHDPSVAAIILTGADPAFCAGVDLGELASSAPALAEPIGPLSEPFLSCATPLIGAVNGAAYAGGLEVALACHFLIASERARFADTHARLGLVPGWGLTVLLAEAVGRRRARELSTSCRPIDAVTACRWGLVNHVVAHEMLLTEALGIAQAIAASHAATVRRLSELYSQQAAVQDAAAWRLEAAAWSGSKIVAGTT